MRPATARAITNAFQDLIAFQDYRSAVAPGAAHNFYVVENATIPKTTGVRAASRARTR
jgi:hypothetical protein